MAFPPGNGASTCSTTACGIEEKNNEWNWNHVPVPTDLCDLCADRVGKKREPSCVHHCLAQVMRFGPIDELVAELDKKPKQVLFVPR